MQRSAGWSMLNFPPNNTPQVSLHLSPIPRCDRTAFSHEHDNLWLWSCLAHYHCVLSQEREMQTITLHKINSFPQAPLLTTRLCTPCLEQPTFQLLGFLFQQLKKFVFHYLYKTSRLVSAGWYVRNIAIDVWKLTGHGTVLFIS